MKLLFTNTYNETNKDEQRQMFIEINGKCDITNYNPKDREYNKNKGDLRVEITENGVNVMGKKQSNDCVKLNNNKYSIFTALATMDKNGSDSELTFSDLDVARHSGLQKLKDILKNLQLEIIGNPAIDPDKGIFRLNFKNQNGKEEIIRIDFETESEKANAEQSKSTETAKNENKTTDSVNEKQDTTQTQPAKPVAPVIEWVKLDNSVIEKFTGGAIDIKKVKDIESVAKYTGVSAEYIKSVLVNIEKLKTKAYRDGKNNTGTLTIGVGHTSLIGAPRVTENLEITEQQAYQILANDIMTTINEAKRKLGKLYDEAPKSIQYAIIDLVYNKGPAAINESLKANLKNKYYHSAARRTWYKTDNIGLQKRNMYRFIYAITNLNNLNKENAVRNFYNEHETHLDAIFQKDALARADWNKMCDANRLNKYKKELLTNEAG